MHCKKAKLKHLKDMTIICINEDCKERLSVPFAHERTGETFQFEGCIELLNCFFLKEIWLRVQGMQAVTEQTRNAVAAGMNVVHQNTTQVSKIFEKIIAGAQVLALTQRGGYNPDPAFIKGGNNHV